MEENNPLPSMKTEDSPVLPRTLAVSESLRFDCLVEYEFRHLNHQGFVCVCFCWCVGGFFCFSFLFFFWTAGNIL